MDIGRNRYICKDYRVNSWWRRGSLVQFLGGIFGYLYTSLSTDNIPVTIFFSNIIFRWHWQKKKSLIFLAGPKIAIITTWHTFYRWESVSIYTLSIYSSCIGLLSIVTNLKAKQCAKPASQVRATS